MITEEQLVSHYRTHVRPLYRYVSRRTGGNRPLSEDVVQETWMRALRDWPSKGLPREPLAWLTTVARNLLADYYRRRRPHLSLDFDVLLENEVGSSPSPEGAALLHCALEKLRPKHAFLIEAFHFDGKPLAEIATELGISERAAEGRIRRAREALKARLGALEPTAVAGGKHDARTT